MTTGETVGELYRKRIIDPLSLEGTSSPDLADNSLPEQHAKSYSFFGQSSGSDPIDATG